MKKICIFISILIAITLSTFLFIKLSPSLETGSIALSEDKNFALLEIGNNGLQGIKIKDVTVKDNEKPLQAKIQKAVFYKDLS